MVADITLEDVNLIEDHTNKNLRYLIDSFECCNANTYKKQTEFRFLPGHRNFVLRLPAEIQKMKEQSSKKRPYGSRTQNKAKLKLANEDEPTISTEKTSQLVPEPTDMNDICNQQTPNDELATEETLQYASDTANDMITDEQSVVADDLQMELINKLKHTGAERQRKWTNLLQKSAICEIEVSFDIDEKFIGANSRIKCPYCCAKYTCKYDRYWRTSNLLKHLDSHENIETNPESTAKQGLQSEKENTAPINAPIFDFNELGSDESGVELNKTIQMCIQSLNSPIEEHKQSENVVSKIANRTRRTKKNSHR